MKKLDVSKLLQSKLDELEKTRTTTVETFTTLNLLQDMLGERDDVEFDIPVVIDHNKGYFQMRVRTFPINITVQSLNPVQSIFTATDLFGNFFKSKSKVLNDKLDFVAAVVDTIGGQ